jgi:AraC-like DNA-binding protein
MTINKLYFLDPNDTLKELKDYYFPPYITLAHMFHAPKDWGVKPRILKQYQLQFTVKGAAEYVINDRTYTTRRGDLILHRPNEPHSVTTYGNESYVCISIVFHFGDSTFPLDELFAEQSDIDPHYMGNYSNHHLENKLSEIVIHYRQPGPLYQIQCQTLLLQILVHLLLSKRVLKKTESKDTVNNAKLILIRNHILNHYQRDIQHSELEELVGWSRNYIISQFKKTFGMSPIQYLVWIRLEKAKELALQSGLSIGEIAQMVGYTNVHVFGKTFKRKTGMSLTQFCSNLFKDTPDT